MRDLTYFISLSIDGYIAGPDGQIDFYTGSEDYMRWMVEEFGDALPSHIRTQLGVADAAPTRFDTVLMGRRTYEPALSAGITSPYAHLTQVVFSRSLRSPDPSVVVTAHDPVEVARGLKEQDGESGIYLAGGGELAGQLVDEIDELIIKRYPVVAGVGLPAFGPRFAPTDFALTGIRSFDGGNVVESYRRVRQG